MRQNVSASKRMRGVLTSPKKQLQQIGQPIARLPYMTIDTTRLTSDTVAGRNQATFNGERDGFNRVVKQDVQIRCLLDLNSEAASSLSETERKTQIIDALKAQIIAALKSWMVDEMDEV